MNYYYLGTYKNKPAVYCTDGMGLIWVSHRNRRTMTAAGNVAKIWNAHVRKRSKKYGK